MKDTKPYKKFELEKLPIGLSLNLIHVFLSWKLMLLRRKLEKKLTKHWSMCADMVEILTNS